MIIKDVLLCFQSGLTGIPYNYENTSRANERYLYYLRMII